QRHPARRAPGRRDACGITEEGAMVRWAILAVLAAAPVLGAAQAPPAGASEPFVVEYYYKTRWGFADEFIRLFKKNHFPVLKREIELGHIQRITAEAPRFHGTEDGRWDYRVTLVWKNAAAPHKRDAIIPRSEEHTSELQSRFDIVCRLLLEKKK